MKYGVAKKLAAQAGINRQALWQIRTGKIRTSWDTAKALAGLTGTTTDIWMEQDLEQIDAAIRRYETSQALDQSCPVAGAGGS